jgi:hypothetical protein
MPGPDAESIVRALAAVDYPEDRYGGCALCLGDPDDRFACAPSCPWRQAREWVAEADR